MAGDDGPSVPHREAWLAALADPQTTFSPSIYGRLTVPNTWSAEDTSLPENIVYLVTSGRGAVRVGSTSITLESGSFLSIAHGVIHSYWIPPREEPLTLYFFHFAVGGSAPLRPPDDLLFLPNMPFLLATFQDLYDEWTSKLPLRVVRIRLLLALIFADAYRHKLSADAGDGMLNPRQRMHLMAYLERTIRANPEPRELAEAVGLSPVYFRRLFKNTYGMPPRTWLVHERIRRAAAELPSSDKAITRIAADYGYRNTFLFSRQFRQVMGFSPRAYRALQRSRRERT